MINFFRKIRQQLLSENRFTRYLIYAFGEIVLVMVGILLALQVNNWNNKKEAKIYEKKILLEIKGTLQNDLNLFERLERRMIAKEQAIDSLLLVRKNKIVLTKKQTINAIENASLGILFSYDKGAYETLKSSGLEKIKTDTLRNKLIRFYETSLPRTESLILYTDNEYLPILNKKFVELKKINFYSNYFKPKDSVSYSIKAKYDITKIHSKEYYSYLIFSAIMKDEFLLRISPIIKDTKQILNLVNKELNTRFKD